jgi:ribosome-binding factor A
MSRRTERLGSLIKQEIAVMIQRDLNDPRVPAITSVTRVSVAEDLSTADVYVSIMGTEGEQQTGLIALRHSAGVMRTQLTKALSTRTTPFLKFHIDENLKKEMAVLDLLHQVAKENEELDRKRAEQQQEQQPGDDASPSA